MLDTADSADSGYIAVAETDISDPVNVANKVVDIVVDMGSLGSGNYYRMASAVVADHSQEQHNLERE